MSSGRCGPRPSRGQRREGARVQSTPLIVTVPASGGGRRRSTLNSVVLPAPLGPSTARRSPRATSRSTPPRASRPPKATTTSTQLHEGRDALRLGHARRHRLRVHAAAVAFRSHGLGAGCGAVRRTSAPVGLGHAVDDRDGVARPRQIARLAAPGVARRRRGVGPERAAEGLVDVRDDRRRSCWTTSSLSSSSTSCCDVGVDDALAVLVERHVAVGTSSVIVAERLAQRGLAVGQVAVDRFERLDRAPCRPRSSRSRSRSPWRRWAVPPPRRRRRRPTSESHAASALARYAVDLRRLARHPGGWRSRRCTPRRCSARVRWPAPG